jgi:hypothetical protein
MLSARIAVILALVIGAPAWAGTSNEEHLRLQTRRGPIHLWTPQDYDPSSAATIIYVHGYYVDVDTAWQRYRLRDQFRESGVNALFIVCEAPRSERDTIAWSSLGALLDAARTATQPRGGRLIAIGHSGAHRTLSGWLGDAGLDTIVLIDAAYGELAPYAAWLEARPGRRLLDVGSITRAATDAFHRGLPDSLVIERLPDPRRGGLPDAALDARVVYVRARASHMELVTDGIAIPMLLRTLAVPLVPGADRTAPLQSI